MTQRFLNFDAQEANRLSGQKPKILERQRKGPALNVELNEIGFRYGARLKELRDAGYRIKTDKRGGGLVEYTLEGEP